MQRSQQGLVVTNQLEQTNKQFNSDEMLSYQLLARSENVIAIFAISQVTLGTQSILLQTAFKTLC